MDTHELYREGQALDLDKHEALDLAERMRGLVGVSSAHELSSRVCIDVRELLKAEGASFVLSEGERVYYADESAEGRLWRGRRFAATACISGWAITHRSATSVRDVYEDQRVPVDAYRPTFVRSLAMAPMLSHEGPLGALGAYWSSTHAASAREMFLLRALADAGAQALLHTRLLDDGRRLRAAELERRQPGGLPARLLPIVAHDLRTPLSAIVSGLEVLEAEDLSSVGRSVLGRMRSSSARGARMVGQLMDYSEIEHHGALTLELVPTRLDELAEQAVREGRVSEAPEHLTLEATPVSGLWDRDRLLEAITNLIRNAVEHGDSERPITVSVGDDGREARVSVHNWGKVIPGEHFGQLFEAFRRFGEVAGSIGLGLYITEQIAKGHGGRVDVTSTDESGTTFSLVLPKDPATFR